MRNKSFTLIELLVVIVIIGILAGVIMISTSSSIDKANFAKLRTFSESIKNSMMMNLMSEFKFDEGSGSLAQDTWSSSFTGSLVGFTSTTASYGDTNTHGWMSKDNCISGTCLKFDTAQSIGPIAAYPAIGDNSFTWEFWGKTNNTTSSSVIKLSVSGITNWRGEFAYPHGTTKKVLMYIRSSCYRYSNKVIDDDKWHHVVGVFDRNKTAPDIYIDGLLDNGSFMNNECSTVGSIPSGNLSFAVNNFKGVIDEIKMYNEALTSFQIKHNYIAGLDLLLANKNISKQEYNQRINALSALK